MKSKVILTTLLVFAVCLSAKAQIENFKGIGKFKIGEATASVLIPELAKELKVTVKQTSKFNSFSFSKYSADEILEIQNDTAYIGIPTEYNYCPGTKVFFIVKYKVADILIEGILLTFYNDTLVKFESKGTDEINKAMTLKYGAVPSDRKTIENTSCYKDNSRTTYTWRNGNIVAEDYTYIYYNSSCDFNFFQTFTVSNEVEYRKIDDCNRQEQSRLRKLKEEEKKKGLSDF